MHLITNLSNYILHSSIILVLNEVKKSVGDIRPPSLINLNVGRYNATSVLQDMFRERIVRKCDIKGNSTRPEHRRSFLLRNRFKNKQHSTQSSQMFEGFLFEEMAKEFTVEAESRCEDHLSVKFKRWIYFASRVPRCPRARQRSEQTQAFLRLRTL
jgi:hypothetical protein